MLLELHVKNLALIDNVQVEFGDGFNVLTGETGAGKSIIIGSVNIALGGKVPKDIIRQGSDYAYIELIFSVTEPEKKKALEAMDIVLPDDGVLIISKKIMPSRSVSKINDETVTAAKLREITSLLIDIHGQHEHQSLLYKSKHLEILDEYVKLKTQPLKGNIAKRYQTYLSLKERLKSFTMDQEKRIREADFYRFEIEEIEGAELKSGEEEALTEAYRRFANAQKIVANLSQAYDVVGNHETGKALKAVQEAVGYDESLQGICDQLYDVDSILHDISHEISSYIDNMTFDESRFQQMEERLDVIHSLQAKYGESIDLIFQKLEEKRKKLDELEHYEEIRQNTEVELEQITRELQQLCQQLSEIRKEASGKLCARIKNALSDLNFIDVRFTMEFNQMDHITANGFDEAEFMISTNPGEAVKPLGMVVSGGELSRIMLAIKAVLADTDHISTLIFDEIDTGISGRTAQKVSEKLSYIAKTHQVICITHLPQIAAMADWHFEIKKNTQSGKTTTNIKKLNFDQIITELARLLGGAEITDAVLRNAIEMKELAGHTKK